MDWKELIQNFYHGGCRKDRFLTRSLPKKYEIFLARLWRLKRKADEKRRRLLFLVGTFEFGYVGKIKIN